MSQVMLDIETLGTRPGSIILSIGACVFNIDTGEVTSEFYQNIDPYDCKSLGLVSDPRTVQWWKEQSEEARSHLVDNRVPLFDALNAFRQWFRDVGGEQAWSQGAAFDFPLLEHVYNMLGGEAPWKFWNVRDTRTVYDVCGFDPKSVVREGTYHNALDDCKHQIRCLEEALKNVRS